MRSEKSIQEEIDYVESRIDSRKGHDNSHLIGFRNALHWVLSEEEYEEDNVEPTEI